MAENVSPETPSPYGDPWVFGDDPEIYHFRMVDQDLPQPQDVERWDTELQRWRYWGSLAIFHAYQGPREWRRYDGQKQGFDKSGRPIRQTDRLVITHLKRAVK